MCKRTGRDLLTTMPRHPRLAAALLVLERTAWTAGLVAVFVWAGVRFTGHWNAERDVALLAATAEAIQTSKPDMSLWSPQRIKAWEDTQQRAVGHVLAVMRIPAIKLEVPILEGTDDATLDRAAGHIAETALPGGPGNVGIAGHRDGFFRGLKDVKVGDRLEIQTTTATKRYRIDRIWIVKPDDVSVLGPRAKNTLTLITCYPFYYVGSAPKRFVVFAEQEP